MSSKGKVPNSEQMAALQLYAQRNGKNWKTELQNDWMRASYPSCQDVGHFLQQVRNQLGPSWLRTFDLPEA